MIKTDLLRSRAEMSAVYQADYKHRNGKQMTAETGDHSAPSTNARRNSSSHSAFGWQIKGRSQGRGKGKVKKRENATQEMKCRGLMGFHDSIHSKSN